MIGHIWRTIEQLTRPLGCDCDYDLPIQDIEEEVWEPSGFAQWIDWGSDDNVTPLPEPPLTPDELIAVRQLIEDRFGDQTGPKPPPQRPPTSFDSVLRPHRHPQ